MLPNPGSSTQGVTSTFVLTKAHGNPWAQVPAAIPEGNNNIFHSDIPKELQEIGSCIAEHQVINDERVNLSNGNFGLDAAFGPSISLESGNSDSPSLGSDAAMAALEFNSLVEQLQNLNGLGSTNGFKQVDKQQKRKRGQRSLFREKRSMGLRHISSKVCEIVEIKGRTTYNEVADEIVAEYTNLENRDVTDDQRQYNEKNIRRRVYDAFNVLMAMDIIVKARKEVQWKGLPSKSFTSIEQSEKMSVQSRIENKATYLQELEEQLVGIQELVQRNQNVYHGTGSVPYKRVALPFTLVQTRPHATVEVEFSEDMQHVHLDFNSSPFELYDDAYVVKSMKSSEKLHLNAQVVVCENDEEDFCATPSNYVTPFDIAHILQ